MAVVLDCRKLAAQFHDWVAAEKADLGARLRLATILHRASRNDGSLRYRDLMLKDAAKLGIDHDDYEVDSEGELIGLISRLNVDERTTGVMIFYPIKGRLLDEDVMDLVSPFKDVEGLHSVNLGYLIKYKRYLDETRGIKCVVPATAKAVVKLLQFAQVPVDRSFVAIVNNSMRVGKPLGLMLENLGATVVKGYDRTRLVDLEACVRRADIVVTAVPDPSFRLDPGWVKSGAAVIDVSFQGNVDVEGLGHAGWVTAPDNRIGQVTRALTWVNLAYCGRAAKRLRAA